MSSWPGTTAPNRRRKTTCWHPSCNRPSRYRVWSEDDESDAENACYSHTPSVISWLVGGNGRTAHAKVI